jgi:hypothetical protein
MQEGNTTPKPPYVRVPMQPSQTGQPFGPPPFEPAEPGFQAQAIQTAQPLSPPILPYGSKGSGITVRRAFAGYGIPLNHRSFLLPRKQVAAGELLSKIGEILSKRNPSF